MKLEDVDEARASWMKLDMVCIQLCQGAVSAWCTDKPCIVDSVPDHMVVVAFQKIAAFIPVVVKNPRRKKRICQLLHDIETEMSLAVEVVSREQQQLEEAQEAQGDASM